MQDLLFEALRRRNVPQIARTLYSFRPFSKYAINDLMYTRLSLCPVKQFNDPVDSIYTSFAIECNNPDIPFIDKDLEDIGEKLKARCFVSEVSGEFIDPEHRLHPVTQNVLMWSHYAENQYGICIKYEFPEDCFKDYNQDEQVLFFEEVDYAWSYKDKLIEHSDSKAPLFTKYKLWEYEHEVRLAFYSTKVKSEIPTIHIDRSWVKEIYIGIRCPYTNHSILCKIAHSYPNAKIFQMGVDKCNLFELIPEKVPLEDISNYIYSFPCTPEVMKCVMKGENAYFLFLRELEFKDVADDIILLSNSIDDIETLYTNLSKEDRNRIILYSLLSTSSHDIRDLSDMDPIHIAMLKDYYMSDRDIGVIREKYGFQKWYGDLPVDYLGL